MKRLSLGLRIMSTFVLGKRNAVATLALMLLSHCLLATNCVADEQLRVRDICRLKGQEVNKLQGVGLVVGLKGTGDESSRAAARAQARIMQNLGAPLGDPSTGATAADLEKAGNVAMVFVTVEIPPAGAQQGDQLDCTISATSAKSLEGGTLLLTPLLGPRPDVKTVYALAQGQIQIPDPRVPTSAKIFRGCKMESTVRNEFVSNNKITLILDSDLSSFSTAQYIEDTINDLNSSLAGGANPGGATPPAGMTQLAQAKDPLHVEVVIPEFYRQQPVKFVSLIMELEIPNVSNKKRVVINEREGTIAIGADVLISPVVINHKNLSIEARAGSGGFVPIDIDNPTQPRPKLKNLTDALKSLNVPTEDVIAIIKTLKRNGDLYGELIIQ